MNFEEKVDCGDTDPYWKKEEKICRNFRFRSDLNTYIERIYLRERYRRERKKFIGFILIVSFKKVLATPCAMW